MEILHVYSMIKSVLYIFYMMGTFHLETQQNFQTVVTNEMTKRVQFLCRLKCKCYIMLHARSIANSDLELDPKSYFKFSKLSVPQILAQQKGTSRQRSGKGAIRKKDSHSKKTEVEKNQTNNQVDSTYTMKTYRKPNEQLFSQ